MTKILGKNNLIDFQLKRLNQYDDSSINSIKEHAELLNTKSLKQLYPLEIEKRLRIAIKKTKAYLEY